MYMGIRPGEPCPTIAMKVGVGRARRESGVMEEVRVRMYSWQFCGNPISTIHLFSSETVGWKAFAERGKAYTAEEMPYENY